MQSGMRAGGGLLAAARLAPNAVALYFPIVVLGGPWWVGLIVVAVFLAVVAGVALRGSVTERAVDRALRSGEQSGISWALVDTEAKRRLTTGVGPRFWLWYMLLVVVGLVLWVSLGEPRITPARVIAPALVLLSSATAAWGERVLRSEAARWLAAGRHGTAPVDEAAHDRIPGGAGSSS